MCLQVGRVQGTHLTETTGSFDSPVSSVADGAHCSLASQTSWRKHRGNEVSSVFLLEMVQMKITT